MVILNCKRSAPGADLFKVVELSNNVSSSSGFIYKYSKSKPTLLDGYENNFLEYASMFEVGVRFTDPIFLQLVDKL